MLEQSVVYLPRLGYPLHVTAKRYWLPELERHWSDSNALTLIFLHSTSFHKETWEPTIEAFFRLVVQSTNSGFTIREAWAIDAPNHGVSAELNEKELLLSEFSNCLCLFISSTNFPVLTALPRQSYMRKICSRCAPLLVCRSWPRGSC
jgi:hypothetical protein